MTSLESVGLIGLGLMGGSLARALHALDERPIITAWSRDDADLALARAEGVVDHVSAEAADVAGAASLVVYATPLGATLDLMALHHQLWADGATITDVASLKAPVVERIIQLGCGDRFVGSHPMVGGERSGFGASQNGLFHDAAVWLTSDTGDDAARPRVERLWSDLGATPRWTTAASHDKSMVWLSHLPQLAANALASVLAHHGWGADQLGPGGRDMTRLAGSSPDMWADLLTASASADATALDALARELEKMAAALMGGESERVAQLMSETRAWKAGADQEASPTTRDPERGAS